VLSGRPKALIPQPKAKVLQWVPPGRPKALIPQPKAKVRQRAAAPPHSRSMWSRSANQWPCWSPTARPPWPKSSISASVWPAPRPMWRSAWPASACASAGSAVSAPTPSAASCSARWPARAAIARGSGSTPRAPPASCSRPAAAVAKTPRSSTTAKARPPARCRSRNSTRPTCSRPPATLGYCEHSMQLARSAGRGLSFDPNLRPSLWASQQHMRASINRLARSARWVLPGIAEGRLLTGLASPEEIAAYYLHQGAEAVVLKLGADGAYFRTLDGQAGYSAGCPVPQVVDTVGAGDGFAAGLISARLEGLAWPLALQRANWVGAQAIQVLGDMEGLPYRHQLPATHM